MHRSTHIEKLPKLSVAIPGESNAFQVKEQANKLSFQGAGGISPLIPSHFRLVDFASLNHISEINTVYRMKEVHVYRFYIDINSAG